jgi:hypothetical protein
MKAKMLRSAFYLTRKGKKKTILPIRNWTIANYSGASMAWQLPQVDCREPSHRLAALCPPQLWDATGERTTSMHHPYKI